MYTSLRRISKSMNLPASNEVHKTHRYLSPLRKARITIVMAPCDEYSSLPDAIDALYKNTDYPFDLIVVESGCPVSVQQALEKRRKLYKSMRILYTHHTPHLAQAYNIARIHIRSSFAFFMDSQFSLEKGWLSDLMRCLKLFNADIVCPTIANGSAEPPAALQGRALLISKEALDALGEFDESVNAYYFGLDLNLRAKSRNLDLRADPETVLNHEDRTPKKDADKLFFELQWSRDFALRSAAYIKEKWGIALDAREFENWRSRRLREQGSTLGATLHSGFSYAKLGVTRLMHSLIQL